MQNLKDPFAKFQKNRVENLFFIQVTEETTNAFEIALVSRTIEVLHYSIRIVNKNGVDDSELWIFGKLILYVH